MTPYHAPLKEIHFALTELAELTSVSSLPGYEEANEELAAAILEEAAKFAETVIAPLNQPSDKGVLCEAGKVSTFPAFRLAYEQFVENGWHGLRASPEWGGQGLPALLAAAVEELWCASNLAFSLLPMLTLGAVEAIQHNASEVLKARYLPPMVEGRWAGTMNLTEPQAGSDLSAIRAKAVPHPTESDTYLISGQKIFITWGEQDVSENIIHLVLARLPDAPAGVKGISLFLVPKFLVNDQGVLGQRNDVQCVSIEHKLGLHGSTTAVMSFGDAGGAEGYLIGEAHRGLEYMFVMMNHARLGVGIEGLALGERAYQLAVSYARERVQSRAMGSQAPHPVPIIQHPDVKRMLLSMRAQIEAQRALAYYTAAALDRGERHPHPEEKARYQTLANFLIPIVKGWNTEQSTWIASTGIQVQGGMGYMEDSGAPQLMRDARITSIYEGTTGIQALDLIGRKTALNDGKTARWLLAEARALLPQLSGCEACLSIAAELASALEAAEACIVFLVETFKSQPQRAAAGAVPFLMLMGITLGGWQMARAAVIACERLSDPEADQAFYQAKLTTARFFAEHELVKVSGLAKEVLKGGESTLEFKEAWF